VLSNVATEKCIRIETRLALAPTLARRLGIKPVVGREARTLEGPDRAERVATEILAQSQSAIARIGGRPCLFLRVTAIDLAGNRTSWTRRIFLVR
jgi:hypothetical protein